MEKIQYRQVIFYHAPFYFTRQEIRKELIPYPEHKHDFFEFFLVSSGRIQHRCNDREVTLKAGALQLIRPDDKHQVLPDPNSWGGVIYNCNIRKEEFMPLFSFLINSNNCSVDDLVQTVDLADTAEFASLIQRMERVLELQYNTGFPEFLCHALSRSIQQEVISIFLERTVREENSVPDWLSAVFAEMRKPENLIGGLPRMLELSGRSREHLSRSFKQHYGMAPREYLLDLKLQRATDLLVQRDLSVTQIAGLSGFENLAYFRKCFLARFGITPLQYRKRYEAS